MPIDIIRRRTKQLCSCSKSFPHYVHQDTVRKHLQQDFLRQELQNSILPEFCESQFSKVGLFEAFLETGQADLQRQQIFDNECYTPSFERETVDVDIPVENNPATAEDLSDIAHSSDEEENICFTNESVQTNDMSETDSYTLWNPQDGLYDHIDLSSYQRQYKMTLNPIVRCALQNFAARLDSCGSEILMDNYTKNWNALLQELAVGQEIEIPNHDKSAKILADLTQIRHIRFDCCRNACCAFTGPFYNLKHCPYCELARSHLVKGTPIPFKTFDITSIVRKLRMQYADPIQSELLQRPKSDNKNSTHLIDIWDGKHMQNLKERGFFSDNRDIALGLATDGIALFQIGTHGVWPLFFTNFNLPRSDRYRKENQILIGIIPGPKDPKDFNSFLRPVVDELLHLEAGVEAYDAHQKQHFISKAHLILLQGDAPGLAKMVNHAGTGAYHFCIRCTQVGIWHNAIRCPQIPPAEDTLPVQNAAKPKAIPVHPLKLPLRTHSQWLVSSQYMALTNFESKAERDRECRINLGVTGFSQLLRLKTIEAPVSFVTDAMHILFQNIVPHFFQCWLGSAATEKETRTKTDELSGFSSTNDYHIGKDMTSRIAEAQRASQKLIPKSISETIPSIVHHKHYTASMRMVWLLSHSPILLKHWSSTYYNPWFQFVSAISALLEPIKKADISSLRLQIARLVIHFEQFYYRGETARLHLCRSQIHALLHLMDSVESFGPLDCYWQFPMERICGRIKRKGHSRSAADRNLSLIVLYTEQLNHLTYVCLNNTGPTIATELHTPSSSTDLPMLFGPGKSELLVLSDHQTLVDLLRQKETQTNNFPSPIQGTTLEVVIYHRALCLSPKERLGNFLVKCSMHADQASDSKRLFKINNIVIVSLWPRNTPVVRVVARVLKFARCSFSGISTLCALIEVLPTTFADGLRYLEGPIQPADNIWCRLEDIEEPLGVLLFDSREYLLKFRTSIWTADEVADHRLHP